MRNLIAIFMCFLFSTASFAEIKMVTSPSKIKKNTKRLNKKIHDLLDNSYIKDPETKRHIQHFLELEKKGVVSLGYFTDSSLKTRGMTSQNEDCDCHVIYLNEQFIDWGILGTLVHEFEHIKHNLEIGESFFSDHREINELTDLFGEYYFANNLSLKKNPKFMKALFLGSSYLFFTEYKAFLKQIKAIKTGSSPSSRPEKSKEDVIETVANDYFLSKGILIDAAYAVSLAELSDEHSSESFLLSIMKSDELYKKFVSMQK